MYSITIRLTPDAESNFVSENTFNVDLIPEPFRTACETEIYTGTTILCLTDDFRGLIKIYEKTNKINYYGNKPLLFGKCKA